MEIAFEKDGQIIKLSTKGEIHSIADSSIVLGVAIMLLPIANYFERGLEISKNTSMILSCTAFFLIISGILIKNYCLYYNVFDKTKNMLYLRRIIFGNYLQDIQLITLDKIRAIAIQKRPKEAAYKHFLPGLIPHKSFLPSAEDYSMVIMTIYHRIIPISYYQNGINVLEDLTSTANVIKQRLNLKSPINIISQRKEDLSNILQRWLIILFVLIGGFAIIMYRTSGN